MSSGSRPSNATMDYLGLMFAGAAEGSIWTNLAAPAETPNQKARQAALARAIAGILTNPSELMPTPPSSVVLSTCRTRK